MPATDPFLSAPDDAEVRIRFFTGTRDRLVIVPTVAAARRRLPRILGIAGIRELRTVAVWEDERGLCQLRATVRPGHIVTPRFTCTPNPAIRQKAA